MDDRPILLQLNAISKSFGSVRANHNISLDLRKGEIHALLGENGAGKTTLMSILYGLYHPDEGEILLRGERISIHSPRDAIQHRIGMIHQHFMLIPNLTIVENIILGLPAAHEPFLDIHSSANKIVALAKEYGFEIDPFAYVRDLPIGAQQRVEILKAIYRGADILILDEPTAVLSPIETGDFFKILMDLVQRDLSVIFISHKLDEVMAISDRISVLRRGEKVATVDKDDTNAKQLAEMMVGRELFLQIDKPPCKPTRTTLRVKNLSTMSKKGSVVLKDITFDVSGGEILGIAGVDGNGQAELADVICGIIPLAQGVIWIDDKNLTNGSPRKFIQSGVSYIPADRQKVGLILNFSVQENLIAKDCDDSTFSKNGVLNLSKIENHARKIIEEFDIRAASPRRITRLLSGGNQQKVIIGREINKNPRLLVAAHPTRGLDIGATEYIRQQLIEQRNKGTAILLISADLDEVISLSDRVAVMFRGAIMGIVPGEASQLPRISQMMLGDNG